MEKNGSYFVNEGYFCLWFTKYGVDLETKFFFWKWSNYDNLIFYFLEEALCVCLYACLCALFGEYVLTYICAYAYEVITLH